MTEKESFTVENTNDPLREYRAEIDSIDSELTALFCRRMDVAEKIAQYKAENALPVHAPEREAELLANICSAAGEKNAQDVLALYRLILSLSRARQKEILSASGENR